MEEVGHSVEELTLDTVEFCPTLGATGLGVVGAYDLHPDGQTRHGSLALFRIRRADHAAAPADKKRKVEWLWRGQEGIDGVLDFKWCVSPLGGSSPLGAAAQAQGQVSLWRLAGAADEPDLVESEACCLERTAAATFDESPQSLALSLDWNNKVLTEVDPAVVASYSSGHLCVWRCTPAELVCDQQWQAHSLEAWIAAYDHWNPNIVYSGSDDCTLKLWDLRAGTDSPIFTKRHDMGVTTVQSHPHLEHTVATGSYDEMVSIWDKRMMTGRAQPVAQRGTEGGGVWRIKWHPHDPRLFVIAAMHRGFFVMRWAEGGDIEIVAEHTGRHESLAYGVDWSYHTDANGGSLVGSCSFYDKTFSVWSPAL